MTDTPLYCPTCDGAMLDERRPRCVRCGPVAEQKQPTLAELLEAGVPVRIETRDRRGCLIPVAYWGQVRIGKDHEMTVARRGVLMRHKDSQRIEGPGEQNLLEFYSTHPMEDRAYWSGIREQAFALVLGRSDIGHMVWKRIKEYRMQEQAKCWDEVLPKPIVAWANKRLAELSKDYDCVDNDRVARVGNTGQMRRYRKQKQSGCCGSFNTRERGPDGRQYVMGFNYGH